MNTFGDRLKILRSKKKVTQNHKVEGSIPSWPTI